MTSLEIVKNMQKRLWENKEINCDEDDALYDLFSDIDNMRVSNKILVKQLDAKHEQFMTQFKRAEKYRKLLRNAFCNMEECMTYNEILCIYCLSVDDYVDIMKGDF